ncbi:hypothetical protein L1887_11066 [Cichorium endivia]|nr:hypothetical protein L1887_11066 [Cichorium endivia]
MNIEKNFDNALGLEDQPGGSTSTVDASDALPPEFMAFTVQKDGSGKSSDKHESSSHGNVTAESSKKLEPSEKHDSSKELVSSEKHESSEKDESSTDPSFSKEKEDIDGKDSTNITEEHISSLREASTETSKPEEHQLHTVEKNIAIPEEVSNSVEKTMDTNTVICEQADGTVGNPEEAENIHKKHIEIDTATSHEATAIADNHIEAEADSQAKPSTYDTELSEISQKRENSEIGSTKNSRSIESQSTNSVDEVHVATDLQKSGHEENIQDIVTTQKDSTTMESEPHEVTEIVQEGQLQPHLLLSSDDACEKVPEVSKDDNEDDKVHTDEKDGSKSSDNVAEVATLKNEMKKMEAVLLGAARQAQAKADEISRLMYENEQLKSVIEDQRRKSNEADMESLREECHQRVSTLERKVYALTRERDTLRREQNKRSDATALLKEKDDIISQVMAEGEMLSKKQAVQESTIRKLRAQIREFEEEKKGLLGKLQVEENKVENLKSEKATTEKLMQETIDKNQSEIATQKEYYINALNVAKEAKKVAEARANDEARTELESRLREAGERESMLIQTLEELRQTLSRKEQQGVFREDMLRREIDDLQKRYQASELRCEALVSQVPESTRPLLRQIEAMQETTAKKAEAWTAVERSLNIRLQDAEAKAAAAEEKNRSVNERLSQTLSRINVVEAQISCLRSEQTQLTRSLEKERQRASESRREYLALKEEADTHKVHANQLQAEMRELKKKHKREVQETLTQRELLQQKRVVMMNEEGINKRFESRMAKCWLLYCFFV